MDRKWYGRIFLASAVTVILSAIVVCLYYNVFHKEHEGPMEPWAVLLMVVPFAIMCISRIIIEVNQIDVEKHNNIVGKIFSVLGIILLLPIFIIYAIIASIILCFTGINKKSFRKLTAKGFQYRYKHKKYILQKENVVIEVFHNLEEYNISFDGGETFVKVEDSHLGTVYEREELKFQLYEYQHSHPVDRQRGDAVPPLDYYIAFLTAHLE